MKIDFYKHNLEDIDRQECMNVLHSLFLTTGEVVSRFEKAFSQYTGNEYVVGVNSCTDALFLALKYFNIQRGDEVITTPLSFIATTNVIEHCGGTPVFVDVESSTGNIDASLIEGKITSKTKAIVVVHLYGHMCDMKKIRRIADKYNLKVIEDCAHCIEGEREGIKPGQLGDVACFSFYATKNITSGEGGAITCHSIEAYEWFKKARLHGMSKNAADRYTKRYEHYDMEFLGYKTNMTNIQAALLIHQLDRIENILSKKKIIWERFDDGFKKNNRIKKPKILPKVKHAMHLYTIWVENRDSIIEKLQDLGIGVAVNYRPIHYMSYYRNKYNFKKGMFPEAERIGNSAITLPFYAKLTDEEIDYIINCVNACV